METSKLEPCSIGLSGNSECHKASTFYYGPSNLHSIKNLAESDQQLLMRRSGLCSIKESDQICSYHKAVLLTKFEFLQKYCCNPFEKENHHVLKGLRPMDIPTVDRLHILTGKLLKPGQKLCTRCRIDFNTKDDQLMQEPSYGSNDDDYVENPSAKADTSLQQLGISPLKFQKVSKRDSQGYARRKINQAQEAIVTQIAASSGSSLSQLVTCDKCTAYDSLLAELKQKLNLSTTTHSEKLQMLTLAPENWSIEETMQYFNVSYRMISESRNLKLNCGILALPSRKKGRPLAAEIEQRVKNFYENDEFSRLCPGAKDYVAVRINGEKQQMQKRLLLCNLKELYTAYQECNGFEIGFSKFCELRPKWCITVGSPGSHRVCVCTIHQNVKLMLAATDLNVDYKTLMAKVACNTESKDCMLQRCELCPGKENLENFLLDAFKELDPDDEIEFKQWIHTDRDNLTTCTLNVDDFISELCTKIHRLTMHHFISKHQSAYLSSLKENLQEDSVIILMDFSENYSFVVQDAVQGFRWDNSQATVHPFMVYCPCETGLQNLSICIISDCLQHDTITVHSFLRSLFRYLKDLVPTMKRVYYFSDGSAAQYKNYKNFINLCYHKHDFGLEADWNFFGTSHGKSPCDGIGGTVKRLAAVQACNDLSKIKY